MKALTCGATRRRLQAFHDGELDVANQIAVSAHLDWCDTCAAELADMRAVGSALRRAVTGRGGLSRDDASVFNATVVSRLKAENAASFFTRVHEMFDDMHLVYAGLGATAATVVCVVIMLSMMRFATNERPDSLAAMMTVMATPLECEFRTEAPDAWLCRDRWVERVQRANETAEQDAVLTLEAILKQHARQATLPTLAGGRQHMGAADAELVEGLLDAVSRARLEPAAPQSLPTSVTMLWLVEHATVRASKQPPLDVPLPPKKRAAGGHAAATIA